MRSGYLFSPPHFLGIDDATLRSQMQSGKNVIDIATAHGKTTAQLRTFLVEQAAARIDEPLAAAGKTATAV